MNNPIPQKELVRKVLDVKKEETLQTIHEVVNHLKNKSSPMTM